MGVHWLGVYELADKLVQLGKTASEAVVAPLDDDLARGREAEGELLLHHLGLAEATAGQHGERARGHHRTVFDVRDDDVYACVADVGWEKQRR